MFLRGDTWYYDFVSGGTRYRGSTGFKKNEKSKAEREVQRLQVEAREKNSIEMIWEQTKRRITEGKEISLEFSTLWDEFTKRTLSRAGATRMRVYAGRLRTFCLWMKARYPEIQKVSEVLPCHAQEFMKDIRTGKGSNATKNDYLVTLNMVFAALGKDCGVIENPFESIKKLKNDAVSRESFTPYELAVIGREAKGWIYSLCLTAVSTGLREGDICNLRKQDVNLQEGWISLKTRKTKTSVEIPILPGLRKHLEERMAEAEESEFVFPELEKMYRTNQGYIGKGIKKFFEEIGITGAQKSVDGYKRVISTKDVHSFRHTFVYLAAIHGIPFPVVQGIVGHASPEMTKHYMDHANREKKAEYLTQLPDYITSGLPIPDKKEPVPKALTSERVVKLLRHLTPENLERNKVRLISLLRR